MLSFEVKYAIQVLAELDQAGRNGDRLKITEIRERCGMEPHGLTLAMAGLRRHRWVESINNRYYITKELSEMSLYDLILDVDRDFCMGKYSSSDGWPYINRHNIGKAIDFDKKLHSQIKKELQSVTISELLPEAVVQSKTKRHKDVIAEGLTPGLIEIAK